ncbi:hypothetical protein [Collimonas humicola]|uniref:hypothetical protein n=1 Tax=Collimonas humicola TaxID=2825886 RepID=UPI001B8B44CD|nr:hypothetical protein [Collimonas humicola]
MDKGIQTITPKIGDRVTFETDEGTQTGYVNSFRRSIGNGELHMMVEQDHQWPGMFRAVPLSDVRSAERLGPPSRLYFDPAPGLIRNIIAGGLTAVQEETSRRLARAERALLAAGFTDHGGQEWKPPVGKMLRFIG